MKPRQPNPRKLDVAAAAADAAVLEGSWPLVSFARIVEGAGQGGDVQWSVRGEQRTAAGREPEVWLHVVAHASVWRDCQRCLEPVALHLDVARALRFVADEAVAEALDADSEDDVLALPRSLDLHALVEDELLLALPLVPMHAECPHRLPMSAGTVAGETEIEVAPAKGPFAVLSGFRREPGRGHKG
jgi:uncharacterized protein